MFALMEVTKPLPPAGLSLPSIALTSSIFPRGSIHYFRTLLLVIVTTFADPSKEAPQSEFGHLDLLDDAYDVLVRCMHELGSPYHAKIYLKTMAELFGDALEFAVLYATMERPSGPACLSCMQ